MNQVRSLHNKAMDYAGWAFVAKFDGNPDEQLKNNLKALEFEKQAAELLEVGQEPTRSILYRSAATLAVDCGDYQEARKLAQAGLDGNPPQWVADELNEVLKALE